MQSLQHHRAIFAPFASPEALQRRRIEDRIGVSGAVAGALSDLAFGSDRRNDLVDLATLTANRTTSCAEGIVHGR